MAKNNSTVARQDYIPKQKEERYLSPEKFKEFAMEWASGSSDSFVEYAFGGGAEIKSYGQASMMLDEQSRNEMTRACAELKARLTAIVIKSKVVRVNHLSTVSINGVDVLKQSEVSHA